MLQLTVGVLISSVTFVPSTQAQSIFSWFSDDDTPEKQDLLTQNTKSDQAKTNNADKQQAAFGELVYHYFQENYQHVLLLVEVGNSRHGFSELSKDDSDRLQLMQGAAQLHVGLYDQSQAIFSQLLSKTTSSYVQANTWFFMAKSAFENKQANIVENAYAALQTRELASVLSESQWHELHYLTAYLRMQAGQQWQTISSKIPNQSIYSAYLLANHASNLFNDANYAEATTTFTQAKQALLAYQNRMGLVSQDASSVFESMTWLFSPWRWFDSDAISEQAAQESQAKQSIEEQNALFDRINIGLGLGLLQQHDLDNAIAVIQNIANSGADADQALLTYGWANAKQNRWQAAMSAWQYLQQNSAGLYALQASYGLAYAFAQQDKPGLAFYALQSTAEQIDTNIIALNDFANKIQKDNFFSVYDSQWPAALDDLKLGFFEPTQTFDASYLLTIRQHAQAILKVIESKKKRVAQLNTMLHNRDESHKSRIASMSLRALETKIQSAQQFIDDTYALIERADTFEEQLALRKQMSEGDERALLSRLEAAQARHARLSNDGTRKRPLKASYTSRLELINGILTWQLMDDFVAQKWQHQKLLKDAQAALKDAQKQYQQLQEIAQREDAFETQRAALITLNDSLNARTLAANNVYTNATQALRNELLNLIQTRKSQLQQQVVNTRLSMLRIQDLQNQGGR